MAYHQFVILETTTTETGTAIPIDAFARLLVTLEAADTARTRIEAQQADGAWHTLATLQGAAELNLENFGWYALRAVCEANTNQGTVRAHLSGRRA